MKNKNCIYFDSYYNNNPGIWFFVPTDMKKFNKKLPCKGFGQIKYSEGSLYTGEIYFDGQKYHKQGYGQQDFTLSSLGSINPETNLKIYLFVGFFDYKKTNWIHGNGVLYYRDKDGKPSKFVKGFFTNLSKIGEYEGEFDYSLLVNGYSTDMEIFKTFDELNLIQSEIDLIKNIKEYDTLFIGDSYFEFWYYKQFAGENTFDKIYDNSKFLNIGVGGTKFKDWIKFYDQIKDFPKFKNIVVNLGFNDLHHSVDTKPTTIYNDFLSFLNLYRKIFNDSNFYFLTVCHSEAYRHIYKNECTFNKLLKDNAKENNITIIENSKVIFKEHNTNNCFDNDNVHLNPYGYKLMIKNIEKYIK